jgi:hypothetical protein
VQRVLAGLRRCVQEVRAQRAGEDRSLLLDVGDLRAQLVARPRPQVAAGERDLALGRLVEALEQREQRRLAGARRPTTATSPRAGMVKLTSSSTGGRSSR